MSPPPHLSTRAIVAVLSVAVLAFTWVAMRWLWRDGPSIFDLSRRLILQLVHDVRSGSFLLAWLGIGTWGVLHVGLHFTWLANNSYTHIPWLDLASHAMGGVGVAGILYLGLRNAVPERVSDLWFVLLVLAIGTGFELYEFLFKSFWYSWPVEFYLRDTLLDISMNTLGAGLVVLFGIRVPSPTIQGDVM